MCEETFFLGSEQWDRLEAVRALKKKAAKTAELKEATSKDAESNDKEQFRENIIFHEGEHGSLEEREWKRLEELKILRKQIKEKAEAKKASKEEEEGGREGVIRK